MKLRPSVLLPGSAANRIPCSILRESAESPRISTSVPVVTPWPSLGPRKSSFSRIRSEADLRQQLVLCLRRVLGNRRHTEQRRHALNDAVDHGRGNPAAGGETVGMGIGFWLIDHGEHDIARRIHGKGADEGGETGISPVAAPFLLLRRAGL